MTLSILLLEWHSESTEKSRTVLAHDQLLSDRRHAETVDLSRDAEAMDLVLTFCFDFKGGTELGGRENQAEIK